MKGSQLTCSCKDWNKNIDKLNAGWSISVIHRFGGYTGKYFVYCPWCSKKLSKAKK